MQNLTGVAERDYSVAVNDDDGGLSVGVIDFANESQARTTLDGYADFVTADFRSAHTPDDFAITENKTSTLGGHRYMDLRIGFTPLSDPTLSMLCQTRVVQDRREIVLLQTRATVSKSRQFEDLVLVRTLQHRLMSRVALP